MFNSQLNAAGEPKSETQLKLEKIKERKRMIAQAEKEKMEKSAGRQPSQISSISILDTHIISYYLIHHHIDN